MMTLYGLEFLIMYTDDLPEVHQMCVRCLCCAIRILSDPLYVDKYNAAAYAFINAFIEIATNEFSKFPTLIVHLLTHLPEQVLDLGPLDGHSAWRFENTLKTLKMKTNSFKLPLKNATNLLRNGATFVSKATRDPRLPPTSVILKNRIGGSEQFKTFVTALATLSIRTFKREDSVFMADNQIFTLDTIERLDGKTVFKVSFHIYLLLLINP